VIASDRIPILAAAFTIAYAVIYVICTEVNLPLITYHPAIGEIDMLWRPVKRGPAMYWYGWMLTSLIGAVMVAGVATLVPEAWLQRAIAFGSFLAVSYLVVYSIALFIYDQASVESLGRSWGGGRRNSMNAVLQTVIARLIENMEPANPMVANPPASDKAL
jgi:glucan phosphoethanolaminetransferase (alkaline phosphatase superfamily)